MEEIKQISIFDANKYNERFNTVGALLSEKQKIEARKAHNKTDEILKTLESGMIDNIQQMTEDMLKLVFAEDFNKRWYNYNYILRNIPKSKNNDQGLCAVRSAVTITFESNKTLYSKDELKYITTDAIERLIRNNEHMLMKELVRQFKRIIINSLDQCYPEYRALMNNLSDYELLAYFMSRKPDELKTGISLEYKQLWAWLTFGPERIMTMKYKTGRSQTYEVNMINNISFVFDDNFIVKTLDDLNYVYMTTGGRDERRSYEEFYDVADRNRSTELSESK